VITERERSIVTDTEKCVACVACSQVCPTRAIRTRTRAAVIDEASCIDCGACIEACRHDALRSVTSSPGDLKRFKHTVAIPSLTLYAQFGKNVHPGQVLAALRTLGFDNAVDLSWMCEMLAGATDAYLSECGEPWPKISVTCPAVVRLIQIRYPELINNLVPLETARELAAKLQRRRLVAELKLDPSEIGIFFITPCTAIMKSIVSPVGLEESHLDGALGISDVYGDLLRAIKANPEASTGETVSPKGLGWAMAGGEVSTMRNANTMVVRGVRDVTSVFDRIEAGKFSSVDFIEAYICPEGCISGPLTVEGTYAAQRNLQYVGARLHDQQPVKEEKVRSMLHGHFFDIEGEIKARTIKPLRQDLRHAIAVMRERKAILETLPGKDCGACGAPDCATFVEDVQGGAARHNECVFVRIAELEASLRGGPGVRHGGENE
jgi:iron only hydrogenase large subunit-like protein